MLASLSNFEILAIPNATTGNIYTPYISSSITTVQFEAAPGAYTTTLEGTGSTINFGNSTTAASSWTNAQTIILATDTTADILNINLYNKTGAMAITASTVETLNITTYTGVGVLGAVAVSASAGTHSVNIYGNYGLTIGAVTASALNASGMGVATTANGLTMSAAPANVMTITGSNGIDTIIGSTGADYISAGSGNDIITNAVSGSAANYDTIYGGDGYDSFIMYGDAASATVTSTYAQASEIKDFTVGTSSSTTDILKLSSAANTNYNVLYTAAGHAGTSVYVTGSTSPTAVSVGSATTTTLTATNFMKLTSTSTSWTTDLTSTVKAALGSSVVTVPEYQIMYGSYWDATALKAVIFAVSPTTTTLTISTTDAVTSLICTIDMTSSDYSNFGSYSDIYYI
jgi:hypothetical protein